MYRFRWKRLHKSIDRYHYFLDSYSKLMEACSDLAAPADRWLSRLTVSSWLTHIKEVKAKMIHKNSVHEDC